MLVLWITALKSPSLLVTCFNYISFLPFNNGGILITHFKDGTILSKFLVPPQGTEPITFCLRGGSDSDDLPRRQILLPYKGTIDLEPFIENSLLLFYNLNFLLDYVVSALTIQDCGRSNITYLNLCHSNPNDFPTQYRFLKLTINALVSKLHPFLFGFCNYWFYFRVVIYRCRPYTNLKV